MISGKDKIKAYFLQTGRAFFKVYKHGTVDRGNPVFESLKEDTLTPHDAFSAFSDWLSLQSAGRFTLILFPTPGATKGNFVQDFEISFAETSQPPQPVMIAGPPPPDPAEMQRQAEARATELFDRRMDQWELKQAKERVAQLEKELKEGGSEGSGVIDRIMGHLEPHLGSIIPALLGAKTAAPAPALVSGTDTEPKTVEDADTENTVVEFAAILAKNDPDWKNTLKRMTAKVESEPGIISTLKMVI